MNNVSLKVFEQIDNIEVIARLLGYLVEFSISKENKSRLLVLYKNNTRYSISYTNIRLHTILDDEVNVFLNEEGIEKQMSHLELILQNY